MIHTELADQERPEDLEKITLADISIDVMTEAFAFAYRLLHQRRGPVFDARWILVQEEM